MPILSSTDLADPLPSQDLPIMKCQSTSSLHPLWRHLFIPQISAPETIKWSSLDGEHPFLLCRPAPPKLHQTIQDHHLVFAGDKGQRIAEACVFEIRIFNVIPDHNIPSRYSTRLVRPCAVTLSSKIVPYMNVGTCFIFDAGYNYRQDISS